MNFFSFMFIMSLNFTLDDFATYKPDKEFADTPFFSTLLRNSAFKNDEKSFAIISCGGTISSAYSPTSENIRPTEKSPITDTLNALNVSFGLAQKDISTISLMDKDSRFITIQDIMFLLNFLNSIENRRIVVTCGTYGLPLFTQIIDAHLQPSKKILGITGSMLISSLREHDVDFNAGGVVTAVNALSKMELGEPTPIVFASFHGKVYMPEECGDLELHLASHKDVEFYRGQPLI